MHDNVKNIAYIAGEAAKAFADIKPDDSVNVSSGKIAIVAFKRVIYLTADYWLAGLCATVNIALKIWETQLLYAFIIMWSLNIIIVGVFIAIYVKTGHDISLGEDLRRASDTIHEKSRIAGYITTLGVVIQAVFWSGPEQIVIFFRKEIGSMLKMVAVMLFLTAIQTVIWMFLYRTGYDNISGIF